MGNSLEHLRSTSSSKNKRLTNGHPTSYLPLYCFCGNIPLLAELRDCKRDASDGTLEALQKIVSAIRRQSPCRSFTEFEYSTLKTWSKWRRVIGKAEILPKGDNPRFIVTNLPKDGWGDRVQAARFEEGVLYENF